VTRDTVQSRVDIGFPRGPEDWARAVAVYSEHSLRIADHPVMEDWETPYMQQLAQVAAGHGGRVLELGYGMGISTAFIQQFDVVSHYVVECHPDVAARCLIDRRAEVNVGRLHLITGFWQTVAPLFADGSFDGILFDTYPLTEAEVHRNHFDFFETAYRLLRPGGRFTYYSDEADGFSTEHYERLLAAGFTAGSVDHQVCAVTPPADCEYWNQPSFTVPIITR
jgi:guanidinoacetate N-methyltransferase